MPSWLFGIDTALKTEKNRPSYSVRLRPLTILSHWRIQVIAQCHARRSMGAYFRSVCFGLKCSASNNGASCCWSTRWWELNGVELLHPTLSWMTSWIGHFEWCVDGLGSLDNETGSPSDFSVQSPRPTGRTGGSERIFSDTGCVVYLARVVWNLSRLLPWWWCDMTWKPILWRSLFFLSSYLQVWCDTLPSGVSVVWSLPTTTSRQQERRLLSIFLFFIFFSSIAISVYFPCSRIFCLFSTYRLNLPVLCKWAGCELILHFVVWQLANLMSPAIPLLSTNLECVRLA